MQERSPAAMEAAAQLFEYLALRDPLPAATADLVIGFGHFDVGIPRTCVELLAAERARHILFTGGIGAGTADLGMPEARFFRAEAARLVPSIPEARVLVEERSTNTAENLQFSLPLLAAHEPALVPGQTLRNAILVANPYRQRRVWLTCKLMLPDVVCINRPAPGSFAEQQAAFAAKGQDLVEFLPGEINRIVSYGERGWIARAVVPTAILRARDRILAG